MIYLLTCSTITLVHKTRYHSLSYAKLKPSMVVYQCVEVNVLQYLHLDMNIQRCECTLGVYVWVQSPVQVVTTVVRVRCSVHPLAAVGRAAHAHYFMSVVFYVEFVLLCRNLDLIIIYNKTAGNDKTIG